MAVITATKMTGSGSRAITVTTLGASDTLTYEKGAVLYLNNVTAGALTPNIDGDGATTVTVAGLGSVDVWWLYFPVNRGWCNCSYST